ncbi:Similar to CIDEB: Cell death activator CIDE-B (Homo sapiens) [Cotesia congregata]|uniref:Similar to CIDEB: Cell death activator CIDE-B (Homo sapiens) n=1 Tax=Cotesia congregata TaxID=51543 RepID=A0A8J2HBW7_COTCN|nr:Similar to CIDEB: Cell death activator CIDE-B (Homo sapiens) [Cotesia congregata]
MAREELRNKRPFKIWDSWRNVRKGLVVSNFEELLHRGKEKLGVPPNENVSLVLESDGTQVEDGEYLKTLANNTILLLLRHGERWCPTGVDIIRAGTATTLAPCYQDIKSNGLMNDTRNKKKNLAKNHYLSLSTAISAIPKIVCETIHALELHDETPSWKIMDNKGRVTVVLHWDQRSGSGSQGTQQPGGGQQAKSTDPSSSKYSPTKKADLGGPNQRPSLVIQTSLDKLGYDKGHPELVPPRYASPQITVINHDDMVQKSFTSPSSYGTAPGAAGAHSHSGMTGRLVKQGTNSFESSSTIHIHTPECSNRIHQPVTRNGSPVNGTDGNNTSECDFHCCALHEEGRRIAVHKSVATSPIQDQHAVQRDQHQQQTQTQTPSPQPPSSLSDGTRRTGMVKGHVRFRDTAEEDSPRNSGFHMHHNNHQEHDSSESETENTIMEDEIVTSEKFLLLIDQLTVDQKHHLSIKDIGIILERLSSKILDVERLDRESESEECYNWTIKAIIRGDVLRELGVIYNGNYYAISEHPGYKEESEENNEDNEEEEEDRL